MSLFLYFIIKMCTDSQQHRHIMFGVFFIYKPHELKMRSKGTDDRPLLQAGCYLSRIYISLKQCLMLKLNTDALSINNVISTY